MIAARVWVLLVTLGLSTFAPSSAIADDGATKALCRKFVELLPRDTTEAVLKSSNGTEVRDGRQMTYYAAVLGMHGKLRKWLSTAGAVLSVDRTTMADAVAAGEIESVRVLVAAGVSPDMRLGGEATPLTVAAGCGQNEILKYLIGAGADMNAANADGIDPMIHAIMEGNAEAVRILQERGFDLSRSRTRSGLRPIDVAKLREDEAILKLLSHAIQGQE